MSNEWVYKNKARFDSPTSDGMQADVVYKGNIAQEIWYKGKRIWNRVNGFWSWAAPSLLGDKAYRSREYFENVYCVLNGITNKESPFVKYFQPKDVFLDSEPKYFHGRWQESLTPEEREETTFDPPPIKVLPGAFSVTYNGKNESDEHLFSVLKLTDVSKADYYNDYHNSVTRYQASYPCATASTSAVFLPPGTYSIQAYGVTSYLHESVQSVFFYYRKYTTYHVFAEAFGDANFYLAKRSSADPVTSMSYTDFLLDDDGLTNLSDFGYISTRIEISGRSGTAGQVEEVRWNPRIMREYPYQPFVRAGQLRGRLNTEPDGSGREYLFVCNDRRVTPDGRTDEWNIDPDLCIDPETGEYVTVRFTSKTNSRENYEYYTYHSDETDYFRSGYSFEIDETYEDSGRTRHCRIAVAFLERYVSLTKIGAERFEMKLYYIEGFEWYGGAEPQEEENG